ncbi:MAG TPA: hypothetical protein PLL20_10945 [Phycisphaerae bacterium]|nr:hypothetical protein [Phycisphaerae bacterium]HRR86440.1 hypothetical protein [Phycisphaerae bacterium]
MRVEPGIKAIATLLQIVHPLFALVALGQAPPTTAPAAGETPVSGERRLFGINLTDLYVGIEGEYAQRRVRYGGETSDYLHENRDFRLYELVGAGLAGHIYDANLIEYRATLEFGLSQTRFTEQADGVSREENQSDGFLHEYDVSLDVLKAKPVSFSVYARRSDHRLPRRFLPSLHEIDTSAGISSLIIAGPTTTELGLEWSDVRRRGNRDRLDDEELEVSRFYLDHTWAISQDQKLRVQYDHDREESNYQGDSYNYDSRRDELRLSHELAFGSAGQHRLDTLLRYGQEDGDWARDEIEFLPRLSLAHTDKLKTVYRYNLYRFQQDAIDITQHKFDVEALYRPREDLRITVDTFGLYEAADDDVDSVEYGGGFDVSYVRPTSSGELTINLASAFERTEVHGDAGRRYVLSEGHVLGGSRPVYLNQRGIVPGSILAHNERRTRYYVAGSDYLVTDLGQLVRVERIPTGRIEDNEVVYFDYQYIIPAEASMNEFRNSFLVEHAFKFGLTPYYTLESRCEDVNTSEATAWRRHDSHRHRLGSRFDRDRWSAGAEYELYDDSTEPYDACHFTGRASLIRTADHSLDVTGELSRYWFEGGWDRRRVWWLDIDVKDRFRINQMLALKNGLGYRWEDDTVDGTTHGIDLECGFQYVRGALTVDLTVEYDLLSIAGNRDGGFGVYLNVRRNLTHLLPRRGDLP